MTRVKLNIVSVIASFVIHADVALYVGVLSALTPWLWMLHRGLVCCCQSRVPRCGCCIVHRCLFRIHCQLGKDQEHAIAPDVTTPFKDHREACRRLMRYHVYQDHGPAESQLGECKRG